MAYDAYSATAPVEHPAVERQRIRRKLERVIDKLMTALDAIDGDADLEDTGDDEPSLSAPLPYASISQSLWADGGEDDREDDGADAEPSLGSTEGQADQTRWASGGHADLEWQCEDEGAVTGDDEPEMGE